MSFKRIFVVPNVYLNSLGKDKQYDLTFQIKLGEKTSQKFKKKKSELGSELGSTWHIGIEVLIGEVF